MSTTNDTAIRPGLVETCETFLRQYCEHELSMLAASYPSQSHIEIDWSDLFKHSPDVAEDLLDSPTEIKDHLRVAVQEYDLPVPVDFEDADPEIRVVNLNESDVYDPLEISKQEDLGYVGVYGDLAKVTTPVKQIHEAAFECTKCGCMSYRPQSGRLHKPDKCQGCERQTHFRIDYDESEYDHYAKVRVESPPDETGELQSQYIDGDVTGGLVWEGHEEYGLVARSGERVVVYGTLTQEPIRQNGSETRRFEEYLDVQAVEFVGDRKDVDIQTHREEFEEFAARENPVDVFAESIVPHLYATPEWETALELLVAYLFGAPRIDVSGGPTYRGDIHALIISDYSMGKSMVNEAVAEFSPDCIKESVTGMSSDVGLLAAAVKDDFGGDQWTLEPGVLVRGNGGHVILDEIDKTDADLERMNDALEGEQVIDINKAGQSATYKSRCGLLATGNPEESRFNKYEAISEQLDIGQSLLSRFDGIVTMEDDPDPEKDANIAETQGLSYVEAQEYEYGDREELERLDGEVSPEVGRAWVAYARKHVTPIMRAEHVEDIRDWYAEDARQLNEKFAANEDEGGDMPVPATARVVDATIRFSVAFARVNLRDKVAAEDVERAKDLSRRLVGQNFDGEKFAPHESRRPPQTQDERIKTLTGIVSDHDGIIREELLDVAEDRGIDRETAGHEVDKLKERGELYEKQGGELRAT